MNLISGKEALIALANGEEVQCKNKDLTEWGCVSTDAPLSLFLEGKNRNGFHFEFRLKPRTITLNGIEVPAPFEPKDSETFWFISINTFSGYDCNTYKKNMFSNFGEWRTEEEIKQVVDVLRKVFKEPQQ